MNSVEDAINDLIDEKIKEADIEGLIETAMDDVDISDKFDGEGFEQAVESVIDDHDFERDIDNALQEAMSGREFNEGLKKNVVIAELIKRLDALEKDNTRMANLLAAVSTLTAALKDVTPAAGPVLV
jgi:hypothetical protein